VNIGGKPVKVWVCQTCLRFSRGYQVEKYVMKEEKTP
jgi:ribosomal protein L28